ncbi:hypothetical protein M6B38_250860 [Iris pallida]|uniref:Uncharacterized protein n=1 Tax=Iris pallida TaxID=29817 RepID=A0AAX6IJJ2_IRIPA|nr:hypothetical protein M6B38_311650 [Iris pallida]KAJ6853228.1 hypothetical protein M6B38_250860 [Iris pallida]
MSNFFGRQLLCRHPRWDTAATGVSPPSPTNNQHLEVLATIKNIPDRPRCCVQLHQPLVERRLRHSPLSPLFRLGHRFPWPTYSLNHRTTPSPSRILSICSAGTRATPRSGASADERSSTRSLCSLL